jgi:hypothetical protein
MNWQICLVLVGLVLLLYYVSARRMDQPKMTKSVPMVKATLEEVHEVMNNFPPLLKIDDFMKFHYASQEENEVGFLSSSITERASKSYQEHVKKIVFFPDISIDDELLARDQMNELRGYIDEALNAKLDIARKLIWSRRTISAPVFKWSETGIEAKDSAQALFRSIQLLEDK